MARAAEFVALLLLFQVIPLLDARAQLTVDVSRATCAEFLAMPSNQSRVFSAWVMGYFDQKSGQRFLNFHAYATKVASLRQWCAENPAEVVMAGFERVNAK